MDRQQIIDNLIGAVTRQDAEDALTAAATYLEVNPEDLEVAGSTEAAEMVRAAWDLPLEDWSQEDRDALVAAAGR